MSYQRRIRSRLGKLLLRRNKFYYLNRAIIELNQASELRKVFGWKEDPLLDDQSIYEFDYVTDVNERRFRDAESIGTVVCNTRPKTCVDIGTAEGHSAALMAVNAPQAQIYTINIPPEEIYSGAGGKLTTIALERERIGVYYRQRGLSNITQILANTACWKPDIGVIDIAYVDGSHDASFVYNDTLKVMKSMQPGSFVLWHDFNLDLVEKYYWIAAVCKGVETLWEDGFLKGQIFHVRDSWVGIYRVV
jgi:hypothetical protein